MKITTKISKHQKRATNLIENGQIGIRRPIYQQGQLKSECVHELGAVTF